ncbi:hypothetical protein F5148DRAFT_41875 [Russula earlei]|uniref:Uncharacterized protein n=1 Tax=Russula earlei TaxID=71964 RepID=A0ACC0UAS1_9AGAM|nr:hypothetical protein F5148DRAFT_41875 [Russula earlei]
MCVRNWRYIVFASPRRLNLRLFYTGKRPMSEMLDVWPVLPVVLSQPHASWGVSKSYLDSWGNVAGALESEHHHRICQIHLFDIPTSRWERLAAAMEKPFPELIFLRFGIEDNTATSVPDSFFAPLVQHLSLSNCPLRGIPKLLLSSDQLVVLSLFNIPNSGYNSPEDLGTALSVMSRLESLRLQFQSPLYPASRPPPGFTPCVLPALTEFVFCGVHEYLEDLLAQLEAPLLKSPPDNFFHGPRLCHPTTSPVDRPHRIVQNMRQSNRAHF